MNRKNRQIIIKEAFIKLKGRKANDLMSFEAGAKFADTNPYWQEGIPVQSFDKTTGLPILYLCKVLTLDMTFGFRYSYRIGFVTKNNKWNIDEFSNNIKVLKYQNIIDNSPENALISDIKENEDYFLKNNMPKTNDK